MKKSLIDLFTMIEELEESHPDVMVMENLSEFERGKLVGEISLIKEIKSKYLGDNDDNR